VLSSVYATPPSAFRPPPHLYLPYLIAEVATPTSRPIVNSVAREPLFELPGPLVLAITVPIPTKPRCALALLWDKKLPSSKSGGAELTAARPFGYVDGPRAELRMVEAR